MSQTLLSNDSNMRLPLAKRKLQIILFFFIKWYVQSSTAGQPLVCRNISRVADEECNSIEALGVLFLLWPSSIFSYRNKGLKNTLIDTKGCGVDGKRS